MENEIKQRDETRGEKLENYWPLFVLIAISFLAAIAVTYGFGGGLLGWMHAFMGFFLCQFSMLKIFNISGFADGFQMYDILAKRSRTYALIYPFIELGLGLAYLAFFIPLFTYLFTLLVMAVSIVGVVRSLMEGVDVKCACMGTILNVPLSTVTLSEDIGMGVMALLMLFQGGYF